MIGYFDCFAGISGDMALGALLDAGADAGRLRQLVTELGLGGEVQIAARHEQRGHLGGTRVSVDVVPGPSRTLADLEGMVRVSSAPEKVRARTLRALRLLGVAEARIHGVTVAEVHLHELGGADTVVDLLGCMWLLDDLGIEAVYSSALPAGRGWVGELPLPAPATLRILAEAGAPVLPSESEVEQVTPTGAALLAATEAIFHRPSMRLHRVGFGIGARDQPGNAVGLWLGDSVEPVEDAVEELETNLDDMTPQLIAALVEDLMQDGALDVTVVPALMKKGRPGHVLKVISRPDDAHRLVHRLLRSSTSLGIRTGRRGRVVADRRVIEVVTAAGSVRVKVKEMDGLAVQVQPEYEDCRRLALAQGIEIRRVMDMAEEAAWAQMRSSSG